MVVGRHGGVSRRVRMRVRWRRVGVMRMFVGGLAQRCRCRLVGMGIVGLGRLLVVTHVTRVTRVGRCPRAAVMPRALRVPGRIVLAMIVAHILLGYTRRWLEVRVFHARRGQRRRFQVVLRGDGRVYLRGQVGMGERERHRLWTLAVVLQVYRALFRVYTVRAVVQRLAVISGIVDRLGIRGHVRERLRR